MLFIFHFSKFPIFSKLSNFQIFILRLIRFLTPGWPCCPPMRLLSSMPAPLTEPNLRLQKQVFMEYQEVSMEYQVLVDYQEAFYGIPRSYKQSQEAFMKYHEAPRNTKELLWNSRKLLWNAKKFSWIT